MEIAHQEKMMLERTLQEEEAARLEAFQRAPKLEDLKVAFSPLQSTFTWQGTIGAICAHMRMGNGLKQEAEWQLAS